MIASALTSTLTELRRLAPPDSPCPATLVSAGDESLLLVDTADPLLAAAVSFASCEHVWAPIDYHRQTHTHAAIMPHTMCTLRVAIQRRRSQHFAAGEVVTIACSILRGLGELRARTPRGEPAPLGQWWMTDAGKPVIVCGIGESADTASVEALEWLTEVAADRVLQRALGGAIDVCRSRGVGDFQSAERELLNVAAPRPVLQTVPNGSEQLAYVRPARPGHNSPPTGRRDEPGEGAMERIRLFVLERAADARTRVSGRVSDLRTRRVAAAAVESAGSPPGGRREPPRRRRKPFLFALALVILMTTVGVLWPEESPATHGANFDLVSSDSPTSVGTAMARVVEPAAAAASQPAEPAPPALASEQPAAPEVPTDLVAMTRELVAQAQTCDDCSAVAISPAVAADVPAEGDVVLLDDYGGVAVLKLTPPDGSAVFIVIEKRESGWLIREVYDAGA